jgi:predicted transcriptional regulator
LLLTERQSRLLEEALTESLAPSRSFFVAEALNAGLANPQPGKPVALRLKRINVYLPKAMRKRISELASMRKVTQQSVLRHYLLEYIRAGRWRTPTQPMCGDGPQ